MGSFYVVPRKEALSQEGGEDPKWLAIGGASLGGGDVVKLKRGSPPRVGAPWAVLCRA